MKKCTKFTKKGIHGNLLDFLYSLSIFFFAQTKTQVAKKEDFLRSGVDSHSKTALETKFLQDKYRWPNLSHFFHFKVLSFVLITEKSPK